MWEPTYVASELRVTYESSLTGLTEIFTRELIEFIRKVGCDHETPQVGLAHNHTSTQKEEIAQVIAQEAPAAQVH